MKLQSLPRSLLAGPSSTKSPWRPIPMASTPLHQSRNTRCLYCLSACRGTPWRLHPWVSLMGEYLSHYLFPKLPCMKGQPQASTVPNGSLNKCVIIPLDDAHHQAGRGPLLLVLV